MCARCNSGGGDGAPRPVRRPADLDTDIERARERGRDSRRRDREGGEVELTRARPRAHTHVATRERETSGTTRTSSRDPLRRAALRRRRRRYSKTPATKKSHPRNEAASISPEYPETGFSDVRARTRQRAPVPQDRRSAGKSRVEGGEDRAIRDRKRDREKKEKKRRKMKKGREEKRGGGRGGENRMGFMPRSMTESSRNMMHEFVKKNFIDISKRKKCD